MANKEHLAILKQGVEVWNKWRQENTGIRPDLSHANLIGANLIGANLSNADLSNAGLSDANLRSANLSASDLRFAHLKNTVFSLANLSDAKLREAALWAANLSETQLYNADFTNAQLYKTILANIDLSVAKGLKSVHHGGPSYISIDTLYKSGGNIPEAFLRGCGVTEDFIIYARSLVGKAIEFYSCFISYSTKDEEFARRLYSRMRDEKLRVWFAPEDIKSGQKIHEQLERAIQIHDRLLIVLSESSMQSEWVMTEIRNARQSEIRENRRKLFPIRLIDFAAIRKWKCFDADTGKDLAVELREYFIPDFSNWKEHDSFEQGFSRLLRDLKAEEAK